MERALVERARSRAAADVLTPQGAACGSDNWLSDDPTAPEIQAEFDSAPSSPSQDPLSLRGKARHVEADGARDIDSIPSAPTRGVYVVRDVTGPCPSAAPQDSRGCTTWRVVAKVAEITLPAPNSSSPAATPTPTTGPPATPIVEPSGPPAPAPVGLLGPGGRPLTAAELTTVMAADPTGLAGRIAIVGGPIFVGKCPTIVASAPSGPLCIDLTWIAGDGYWAAQVGKDGRLSVVGEISVPQSGFVFKLDAAMAAWSKPAGTSLMIVDAWLDWENDCDAPTDPPYGSAACGTSMLTAEKLTWTHMRTLLPPKAVVSWVQKDAYSVFGSQDLGSEGVHGLYLVEMADQISPTILARLEPTTP